ncbi:hypothetical protein HJC23_006052 [Cyclotella cryptica]|uniref:Transmembrane protein n=1 Tax=Cyclotella cryptica TaxID=29204 RepID=A0ABD3PTH7_9STRA|eukprot:CCRYP_011349-RE/>CCRYP_011349-RE protein AED:0.40 eAED:0.40 QI:207/1/1/1/1/1/2/260/114
MTRIIAVVAAVALVGSSNAFTVPQNSLSQQSRLTALFSEEDNSYTPPSNKFVERGVSMDQDGKSNVWAIEPKMEIENKSSEEKTGGILAGLGALGVFGVIAAGILTNLPDPDQF